MFRRKVFQCRNVTGLGFNEYNEVKAWLNIYGDTGRTATPLDPLRFSRTEHIGGLFFVFNSPRTRPGEGIDIPEFVEFSGEGRCIGLQIFFDYR